MVLNDIFENLYLIQRYNFFSPNTNPLLLHNALALTKSYQLQFHLGFKTNLLDMQERHLTSITAQKSRCSL